MEEICEVNMRFTGFEKLEELSMTQLYALKAHDWSKAVQEIWKVDEDFNDEDDAAPAEDDAPQPDKKRPDNIHKRIAEVSKECLSRDELIAWAKKKMNELHAAGKLAHHPIAWNDHGTEREQRAIMRSDVWI
jgi:hypothetical protein